MATPGPLSRPDWGGPNADIDLHKEMHLGIVDSTFMYTSKLAGYMNIKSLQNTNTLRIDRMGDVDAFGRRSGEELAPQRVVNDKLNLIVDTTVAVRQVIDQFDDWTSSVDFRREYARLAGIAMAKRYDQACLIQAMKAGDFVAPPHLAGAFHNGIVESVSIVGDLANGAADAAKLVYAHRKSIESLVNRDLGDQVLSEGVTFVTPSIFTTLNEHDKLQNVEYGAGAAGNSFAMGRVATMNGLRVIETPRVPTAALTGHPLGTNYDLSAAEARRQIITLIPSLSLVTAQVRPVDVNYWYDDRDFQWVLDTFQAYNVGVRRPDSIALVDVTVTG